MDATDATDYAEPILWTGTQADLYAPDGIELLGVGPIGGHGRNLYNGLLRRSRVRMDASVPTDATDPILPRTPLRRKIRWQAMDATDVTDYSRKPLRCVYN